MDALTTETFERELLRGSLDMIVLSVLAEKPMYGYLIQKEVLQASHNQVKLQAGTLYPLLHRLESNRLIRSRRDDDGGRKRKWYELTVAGHRRLSAQAKQWHNYAECIRKLLSGVTEAPEAPPKPA